jgi:hypothetical protein
MSGSGLEHLQLVQCRLVQGYSPLITICNDILVL